MRTLIFACAAAAAAAAVAGAAAFDCRAIRPDAAHPKWVVDLSPAMKSPIVLSSTANTPPSVTETKLLVNLCAPLGNMPAPPGEMCSADTNICMVVSSTRDSVTRVERVIPFGGRLRSHEPKVEKHSFGGQGACRLTSIRPFHRWRRLGWAAAADQDQLFLRQGCASRLTQNDLRIVRSEHGLLELAWGHSAVCTSTAPPPKAKRGGFPLLSLLLFVIIVYFAAGMWHNYTQYGATGWDLVPNRDFWREAPYLAQDAVQHVLRTVRSGANRGYEPV